MASWLLGYPQAALADTEHAIKVARETGHSETLMYVLNFSNGPISTAGTMRRQTRSSMNLSH